MPYASPSPRGAGGHGHGIRGEEQPGGLALSASRLEGQMCWGLHLTLGCELAPGAGSLDMFPLLDSISLHEDTW